MSDTHDHLEPRGCRRACVGHGDPGDDTAVLPEWREGQLVTVTITGTVVGVKDGVVIVRLPEMPGVRQECRLRVGRWELEEAVEDIDPVG